MTQRKSPSGRELSWTRELSYDYTAGIAAQTQSGVSVGFPEALPGDLITVTPHTGGIDAGLCIAWTFVPAAGFVQVFLGNYTAAPINPGAAYLFHVQVRRYEAP